MSYKNLRLINDDVLVAPSESRSRGMIAIPDKITDGATSCLVLKVGKNANPLIKEGDVVLVMNGIGARSGNFLPNIGKNFLVKSSEVYAIVRNNVILPIGNVVLIKRDIASTYEGSIFIPEKLRSQSLSGEVVRLGVTREIFRYAFCLNIGDKIVLDGWHPEMIEVDLEDGSFGLIVKEEHILYRHEQ